MAFNDLTENNCIHKDSKKFVSHNLYCYCISFVPKGSSQLESAEMTLNDLSIDSKQPKIIYSMMSFSDEVLSPDSEYKPQNGQFGR